MDDCWSEFLSALCDFDIEVTTFTRNFQQYIFTEWSKLYPVFLISIGCRNISIVYQCVCSSRIKYHVDNWVTGRIVVCPGRHDSWRWREWDACRRFCSNDQTCFRYDWQILRSLCLHKRSINPAFASRAYFKIDL